MRHNIRCKFASELVIENFETSDIETVTDTDSRRTSNLKLDPKNIFILEGKYGKILKRFRVGHIQDDKWLHLDSLFIDQKLKPVLISSYYKIKIIYNFAQYICTYLPVRFLIDRKRDQNLKSENSFLGLSDLLDFNLSLPDFRIWLFKGTLSGVLSSISLVLE